jgi:hypothetical protein
MRKRKPFRRRGVVRPKRAAIALLALSICCAPLPALPLADPSAGIAASAFLFNLTQTKIIDVAVDDSSLGVTIAPMQGGQLWKVNDPERMDVPSFYGQTLTVTFGGNKKWTETINARPPPGQPARSIGIWLFINGCVVSTDTGYIQQVAWAQQ